MEMFLESEWLPQIIRVDSNEIEADSFVGSCINKKEV